MEDTTIEDVLKTVEAKHIQKDYASALQTLEANKLKVSEGLWHYNTGTIYGKLENWPMARFHLLKADEEGFSSKELFLNRNLVESKLDIERFEKPISTSDYLIKGSLLASQGILTSISLIFVIIALFGFWKKTSFKVLTISLTFAIAMIGVNFWIISWDKYIVITPQAIQDGPSAIFNSREELPPGLMLVTKRNGDWLEILYPSRFQGWIKNSGLKEL